MPTDQHAQPPDDSRPPPCHCGGCEELRAIYATPRREEPRDVRAGWAAIAADDHRHLAEWSDRAVPMPLQQAV